MPGIILTVLLLVLPAAESNAGNTVVVRAGSLLDIVNERLLSDQMITIRSGRVQTVGPWSAVAVPSGATVHDWSAWTVLPGLMDMHTHLADSAQSANVLAPLETTAAESVLQGVAHAEKTLRAGFTTVRDVGVWRAFNDVALRDAIDAGIVPGPRMLVAGAYITVPGGAGDITGQAFDVTVPADLRFGVVRSPAEVRERVRTLIQRGATFIKTLATGAVLTTGTHVGAQELSEEELRVAVEEAARYGVYVTAHAHGAEGIKAAVRAGVRSIEHGSLLDDEGIELMRERGTWLVADIYNAEYIDRAGTLEGWPAETLAKNDATAAIQRENFRKAHQAGVRMAYGTDSGVYPHGDNALQFAWMVRFGMTPLEAIRAATLSAAEMLGRDEQLGSIAPGKWADLIAVAGNPLEDITALETVVGVMKGGLIHLDPSLN
ncbi:MAG: amidohydrolase family protein [Haliea sp.]|uniref:Xaa-Pro dipeptidase n=1 Tax=Haliea sp. TaxID=1932666 RepID=UPI0032EBAC86